jgi:GNAT superfamily N-acetyltransferase
VSETDGLSIREARAEDAPEIAPLLDALGYPAAPEAVRARLDRILARPDGGALVAEASGRVVALASYQVIDLLERAEPQCRITALVTDEGERRRGAASALIEAIESVARDCGCFRLEVTTRPQRGDALALYARLGFQERRHRLVKLLDVRRGA